MLISDIDSWNVGAGHPIAFELGDELKTVEGVASDLELISQLPGWDSPAADAARGNIHDTKGTVLDDAAVIGAVAQLADETAAAVSRSWRRCVTSRPRAVSQLSPATVTGRSPDPRGATGVACRRRRPRVARQGAHPPGGGRRADCAEVFGHLQAGDVTARGRPISPLRREVGRDRSGLSDRIGNRGGVRVLARSEAALDRNSPRRSAMSTRS